jgi:hypothetical protein
MRLRNLNAEIEHLRGSLGAPLTAGERVRQVARDTEIPTDAWRKPAAAPAPAAAPPPAEPAE